jgi:alpha-2-macroglobulin
VIEMAKMLASDYWCSTHTTSYALMAISKFAVGEKNAQTRYVFFLNEKEGKETLSSKPVALEQLTVDQAYNTVKVHNTSENGLFVRVITSGQPMKGDEKTVQQDLNMSVVYTDMSGALLDVSRIEQGTDFMVNVTISHPGIRYDFHEMALTQIFPSGWEIHNTRLDQVASVHQSNLPRYQDIRDDRVYSYFDISRRHSQTYTILLNASYQGKFYLPSVACEAMYDETINARVPGKWVHVVAPGEMMAGN